MLKVRNPDLTGCTYNNGAMGASIVSLKIKLEATTKKEGDRWVARCVPLDVFSQSDTKESALSSLEEAVHLWFESCLERNVLEEALIEAGFVKSSPNEVIPENASIVQMAVSPTSSEVVPKPPEYIEVTIPAYIAARHLSDNRATR